MTRDLVRNTQALSASEPSRTSGKTGQAWGPFMGCLSTQGLPTACHVTAVPEWVRVWSPFNCTPVIPRHHLTVDIWCNNSYYINSSSVYPRGLVVSRPTVSKLSLDCPCSPTSQSLPGSRNRKSSWLPFHCYYYYYYYYYFIITHLIHKNQFLFLFWLIAPKLIIIVPWYHCTNLISRLYFLHRI